MDIKTRARIAACDIFPPAQWSRLKRQKAYEIILKALQEQRKEDLKTAKDEEETDSGDA